MEGTAVAVDIPRAIGLLTRACDGGWLEGPGYWNYATIYNAYFLSALKTALGIGRDPNIELSRLENRAATIVVKRKIPESKVKAKAELRRRKRIINQTQRAAQRYDNRRTS